MKRVIIGLLLVLAIVLPWERSNCIDDRNKISVDGDAVMYVKPDRIVINLGIETWDVKVNVAKGKNNQILKKAIAVMMESGVPEKEIQTDHLSIEPRWRSEYRHEDFIGYFIYNSITVTLTDPAKVEEIITKILQAGVNHIYGIDYQSTQLKKYREQVRELALRAAKEKADKMAAVLGQTVRVPIKIIDKGSPSWYSGRYDRGRGMSQNISQSDMGGSGSGGGESGGTVVLGKISVRANVEVVFELNK